MEGLTKKQMEETVTVICYREKETLTRREAMKKYLDGMMMCDGSERERYANIYAQLAYGFRQCSDKY